MSVLDHQDGFTGTPPSFSSIFTRYSMPSVPAHGLPVPARPAKRVLILGAGMAGLVAGYELLRKGHEPVILEARQRVGGRIHTIRDFAPGLYAEAGAMRIPKVHESTLGYCREFGLPVRPFVTDNPHSLVHVGGRRLSLADVRQSPSRLPFPLAAHERGRTHEELWQETVGELYDHYERDGTEGLERLAAKYDGYSIRGFLKASGWSEAAIELYGLLTHTESTLNTAVTQEFREVIGQAYENPQEIAGGMDQLPRAFYERLKAHIRFGTEVVAIAQDADQVVVRARVGGTATEFRASHAICTLPFSVLRNVDVDPAFSTGKQKAIRQLHYDASTKIFFQVRRPFWSQRDGIRGGTTVTDLPVRRVVYPSHVASEHDRAVLLASYTWGQDALRWASMEPARAVAEALRQIAKIHPSVREEFETGRVYSWYDDPFSAGAYVLFEPDQQSTLQEHIVRPEGRVYFAGEHCSRWPAWIEGAVESGIKAAYDVHVAEASRCPVG
ncbi:flavin monoamine oxidase family protein [Couchioplanes azureus]|uniref:flavin monoamine oxidase family protein n=1 Tax=Couchioplanes caeruleus TaxID=56438 RepID=UPI00166F866A|nr:flavin monoamine oxidase family protein [Couchioplanes caeruleus]GGQ43762.1 amine oxidase [Couchioplanes caeruleus subsp. azureus]